MAENLPAEDLLLRYLDNEMSADEKNAFEKQLGANAGFREQLEALKLSIAAVKYYGINQQVADVRRQMENKVAIVPKKLEKAKVIGMKKFLRYSMMAAAGLILITGSIAVYLFYQLSPQKVYNETYVAYTLSQPRSATAALLQIEKAYLQKDYGKVIEAANNTYENSKQQLLTALSYQQLNNTSAAIGLFNKILSGNDNTYKQDAEFYLALAYLKNKEYKEALLLMKKIENDPNHLYHKQISGKTIREVEWLRWK